MFKFSKIKFAGVAIAAASLVAVGAGAAGASTAAPQVLKPHASSVCGSECVDVFNAFLGTHMIQNANKGAGVGHQVAMRRASDAFTREDFIPSFTGFTNNGPDSACAKGLLPAQSEACLNGVYANDPVWQTQFAPDSNQTHECVGTTPGVAVFASERVRLQNCGSATTLWIEDVQYSGAYGSHPWINGGDTDFTNGNALVLGIGKASSGYPLNIQQENASANQVNDHLEFGVYFGAAA